MGSLERSAKRKVRKEYIHDQKLVNTTADLQRKAASELVARLRAAKVTEEDLVKAEQHAFEVGIFDGSYSKEQRRIIAMQVIDQAITMSKKIPTNG